VPGRGREPGRRRLRKQPPSRPGAGLPAGAGVPLSKAEQPMIIAYKLGGTGKLPETVGS